MSGPDFEAVLARHLPRDRYRPDGESEGTYCTGCDWTGDYFADGEGGPFDAHLSAALHAELTRWLGDEGTREVVRQAVLDASPGTPTLTCERIATAALAALTTTDQEDR